MEKSINYKKGTPIIVQINTKKKVALQSMKKKFTTINVKLPVDEPFSRLEGRWLIEFIGDSIHLLEVEKNTEDDALVISCEQANVEAEVTCTSAAETRKSTWEHFNMLEVYPGAVAAIKIVQPDAVEQPASPSRELDAQVVHPGAAAVSNGETERLKKENAALAAALEKQKQLLSEALASREDALLREKDALSGVQRSQLESIEDQKEAIRQLNGQIAGNRAELKKLRSRKSTLESEIVAFDEKKRELEEQLDALNAHRDVLELDCDEAQRTLENLTARYELDEATVSLMEDDTLLRKKSVSKAFDEVQKMLEAIERRIALIVNFKTKFDGDVGDIHSGDGYVSVSSEEMHVEPDPQEGEDNGNGGTTQAADR